MAFLQWRRFNFFDKELVRNPDSNDVFDKLKGLTITSSSAGRGQMIFGDTDGNLHILDRDLKLMSFKAYVLRVSHTYQLKQHNILITVGIDRSGNPTCSRIARAIPGNRPTPVSCITAHENLNYMAVGFENGAVVLFKGDITKDRHSKSRTVHDTPSPVSGLSFRSTAAGRSTVLFVVSKKDVVSYTLLPKDKDSKMVLDQHGCDVGCTGMSDLLMDNQFVIGRPDAVYFYTVDGRGPCLAFDGEKLRLHWFRGYLIIVSKEAKPPVPGAGGGLDMNIVTVYDIQNKLIAYSGPLPAVRDVLCDWGALYFLSADSRLYLLQEKDTQTKLEILFRKNLYQLAISLAQSQQYDQDGIMDIFRQYGDHLYRKGDHDGAIQQYIKTIGKLEASYVIRQFLDAQRIHNLTAYLQELHKAQLATEDHTTLLLNCYTKLKDVSKLDTFIMTKDREIDFDVETAIRVCRQAGYHQHALFLSERHHQHDWYLKTQLEDIRDYHKALKYIAKLDFTEAERNLKTYGKVLMSELPNETTDLLKTLCTDYKPSNRPLVDSANLNGGTPSVQRASPDEFIHIFVNTPRKLMEFLDHMVRVWPASSSLVYNTLLELYLQETSHQPDVEVKVDMERKTLDLLQNPNAEYDLDQALVLCQMNNYKAGILYLYEKAKLYQQIVKYHMDHSEYSNIIETCKRFGQHDPNLWIQALSYFARKEENCKQQIVEVLSHIDERNLLPPLLVVQSLAHNSTATLAVVKDYLIRRLQQENDQISEDQRLIKQYREETERMRGQIDELKTSAKIFQVAKCSICSHPLELPSVHFLCQHSYHQHCFDSYTENEAECPVCLPENRKVLDIIRAQEQNRDLHEHFFHQLERNPDGFSVVADYFGRGVFNKVTLITDRSLPRQGVTKRQPPRPPPRTQ